MARKTIYDLEGQVSLKDKDFMAKAKRVKKAVDDLNRKMKIEAGLIKPTKEYEELGRQASKAEKRVSDLNKEQEKLRKKHISSSEYKKLEKDIESAERELDKMVEQQIAIADLPHGSMFQKLDNEIEKANLRLEEMKMNLLAMAETGASDEEAAAWYKTCDALDRANSELDEYRAEMASMEAMGTSHASTEPYSNVKEMGRKMAALRAVTGGGRFFGDPKDWDATAISRGLKSVYQRIVAIGAAAGPARNKLREFLVGAVTDSKSAAGWLAKMGRGFGTIYQRMKKFPPLQKTVGKGFSEIGKHANKMKRGLMMGAGIRGLVRLGAAGAVALYSIRMMKEGMTNLIKYDAETAASVYQLKASLLTLKNALATAFAPIITIVAPILDTFIGWLTNAATAMAHFMAALTGKSQVVVAKKVSAGAMALSDAASAADDANESTKEYQRTLMGFDKINKLEEKTDSNAGTTAAGISPSDMFETTNIDSTMANWADKVKEAWEKADFTEIGAAVARKMNTALENIPWDDIQKTCRRTAMSIATFINGFVETADWKLLAQSISKGIETAMDFVSTFLETVHWQSIGKAIVDFISGIDFAGLFSGAARLAGNIAGAVAGVIAGAVTEGAKLASEYFSDKIEECGGNVVLGILKGIVDAIVAIPKWIVDHIFKPFIDGFKNAFGINSPSTVMAEYGGYIIDGLLEGIKHRIDVVIDWFRELPKMIKIALGNFGELVKSWISGGNVISIYVKLIKQGWDTVKAWVSERMGGSISKGMGLAKDGWTSVKAWVSGRMGGSISKAIGLKKDGWSSVAKWVKERIGGVVKVGIALAKWGWDSLKSWLFGATGGYITAHGLEAFKDGGIRDGGSWKPIQNFAGGGGANSGQLFVAREAGPELVGTIGNRTSIMNNEQIVASVSAGVAQAVAQVMTGMDFGGGGTNVYLEGDAAKFFRVVQQHAVDYTRATGQPAFPV